MSLLTLYLLRHAKSAWDDPKLADFDRPLAPRGEREAADMAALIAARAYRPERVLCSSARRTRETLGAVLQAASRTRGREKKSGEMRTGSPR